MIKKLEYHDHPYLIDVVVKVNELIEALNFLVWAAFKQQIGEPATGEELKEFEDFISRKSK